MSRPYLMTEQMRQAIAEEVEKNIARSMLYERPLQITPKYPQETAMAGVVFTPEAYLKMHTLVQATSSEVAWHGVVEKRGVGDYLITDILVYPQTVTGVTVDMDEEEYIQWSIRLGDEVANHLHMQGHSHVKMDVSPSGTDIQNQLDVLKQVSPTGFYIFMITNKNNDFFWKIVDLEDNIVYDTKDVVMEIGEGFGELDWIKSVRPMLKPKIAPVVTPIHVNTVKKSKKAAPVPQTIWLDEDDNDIPWYYRESVKGAVYESV